MGGDQLKLFGKRPKDRRGGRRPGAGRPRKNNGRVSHRRRPPLSRHHPVHVTVRLDRAVRRNLRARDVYRFVYRAFCYGSNRFGFRIVHYSVQGDHIHLLCEAANRRALSRGMQGFNLRISKGLKRLRGRGGGVFRDRYHERILTTPSEVRNGLRYVLLNARRHAWQVHDVAAQQDDWVDPRSSAAFFDGWKRECMALVPRPPPPIDGKLPVAPARSWLLTTGWKKRGRIATWEIPKGRARP